MPRAAASAWMLTVALVVGCGGDPPYPEYQYESCLKMGYSKEQAPLCAEQAEREVQLLADGKDPNDDARIRELQRKLDELDQRD